MANYVHVITDAITGEVTQIPFTQEEIDKYNSPELRQQEINKINQEYLTSTDWYVVRLVETGIEIPDDILKARQNARQSIVE